MCVISFRKHKTIKQPCSQLLLQVTGFLSTCVNPPQTNFINMVYSANNTLFHFIKLPESKHIVNDPLLERRFLFKYLFFTHFSFMIFPFMQQNGGLLDITYYFHMPPIQHCEQQGKHPAIVANVPSFLIPCSEFEFIICISSADNFLCYAPLSKLTKYNRPYFLSIIRLICLLVSPRIRVRYVFQGAKHIANTL